MPRSQVFLGIFLLLIAAGRRPAAAETAATLAQQPGAGAATAGVRPLEGAAGVAAGQVTAATQGAGAATQGAGAAAAAAQPTVHGFKVVRELPHDPLAFTQGLEFGRRCPDGAAGACTDVLWESTGAGREVRVWRLHRRAVGVYRCGAGGAGVCECGWLRSAAGRQLATVARAGRPGGSTRPPSLSPRARLHTHAFAATVAAHAPLLRPPAASAPPAPFTGLRGRSSLREVDLATGRVLRSHALPQQDFAEGLARVGGRCVRQGCCCGVGLPLCASQAR
jgi:hypothetical protein